MAVTRSSADERRRTQSVRPRAWSARPIERLALLLACVALVAGTLLAYLGRSHNALQGSAPINLNTLDRREQLLPLLTAIASPAEREFAAGKIYNAVREAPLPNVGAIARIPVEVQEVRRTRSLESLQQRVQNRSSGTVPLLTGAQLAQIKPLLLVRSPNQFRSAVLLWTMALLIALLAAHLFLCSRSFAGDQLLLPTTALLASAGYILMLSLRDPLRDTLLFVPFAQGILGGLVLLVVATQVDWLRLRRYSYVPLAAALLLSIVLIVFGTGPGTSDAKVNLGPVQPIEAIRLLLVFFLAGYFANRWELLRELQERSPRVASLSRFVAVPRLEYLLPVLAAVAVLLLFFFLQKDLGPALVFLCLFLLLYAVSRAHVLLSLGGLALMLCGFAVAYQIGYPRTVTDRVQMWLSPWDNVARGGDQLAHSLWALASGGPLGAGIGLGETGYVPAGHTDLVLATLGEEWGLVGLLAVLLLYSVLLWRGLQIARRSASEYGFFLALGLALVTALQLGLIVGGALGLLPLSGVVMPFLSYGRSALLANFLLIGILLALSRHASDQDRAQPFAMPLRWMARGLAVAGLLIVLRLGYVQWVRADATAGAGTLVVQGDGARRFQYNPRLLEIARSIPRGTIYDRNGLVLAGSNQEAILAQRTRYAQAGVDVTQTTSPRDRRHYPWGAAFFHLLGDVRTRVNWAARNSSLAERDAMVRLQGYDDRASVVEVSGPQQGRAYTIRYDYRELLPLLRHRQQPNHPEVQRVLQRERDVRMSIDGRLQARLGQLLKGELRRIGKQRGAIVVMQPGTGDLLASVSYPWPEGEAALTNQETSAGALLDRARYGLYPPGSTFKVVTAMAALRQNPALAQESFPCVRLPDGRVGNFVRSSRRPIRDDVADTTPHGAVSLERGIVVSCNAYFAQLGALRVGAQPLHAMAELLGIATARPDTPKQLNESLPQASYGQGQVVASPFQLARVAAIVAAGGTMPYGRWITDNSNPRTQEPQQVLPAAQARRIGQAMRGVVTNGTGRRLAGHAVPIAGKTGTAELEDKPSHAWFIGYAPYGAPLDKQIAFAVLVENGQYGGSSAAPIAGELVSAAQALGILK